MARQARLMRSSQDLRFPLDFARVVDKVRVFFALWPAATARDALAGLAHDVAARVQGRAPPDENLHMTLAFVGDISATLPNAASLRCAGISVSGAGAGARPKMSASSFTPTSRSRQSLSVRTNWRIGRQSSTSLPRNSVGPGGTSPRSLIHTASAPTRASACFCPSRKGALGSIRYSLIAARNAGSALLARQMSAAIAPLPGPASISAISLGLPNSRND